MVLWKHACYCLSGQWTLFGRSDFSLLLCQLIKQLVLTQAFCPLPHHSQLRSAWRMPAQPSLPRSYLLETFRGRESQTSLPRNAPSGDEGGRDGCIRSLPFLAFLAVFRAPSLQNRCYFVASHRRAKARAKRARSAEDALRRKVRCDLFISCSPFPHRVCLALLARLALSFVRLKNAEK